MKIRSSKVLSFRPKGSRHSYTITPEMEVVSHFPVAACKGLIEQGAEEVKTDTSKKAGKP